MADFTGWLSYGSFFLVFACSFAIMAGSQPWLRVGYDFNVSDECFPKDSFPLFRPWHLVSNRCMHARNCESQI